jgi:hypothetical protein
VLDASTVAFLESGCALIVGTVAPDGAPYASRGWGLTVLSQDPHRVRLLLATTDARTLGHLGAGQPVAITATDVRTLRSMQLKGRSDGIQAETEHDRLRAERFIDAFFTDIVETDGSPRPVLEQMIPSGYSSCVVTVEELYDQTPGPEAGAPLQATGR